MSDDYGYFGKGITGYAHYTQAVKNSSGGGGGNRNSGGCLSVIMIIVLIVLAVCWIVL